MRARHEEKRHCPPREEADAQTRHPFYAQMSSRAPSKPCLIATFLLRFQRTFGHWQAAHVPVGKASPQRGMEPALKQEDGSYRRRATLGGAPEYGTLAAVTTSPETQDARQDGARPLGHVTDTTASDTLPCAQEWQEAHTTKRDKLNDRFCHVASLVCGDWG
jgi:hypothetical protein